MLPTLRVPAEVEFHSPRAALDALENRVVQRAIVQARDLEIDEAGRLSHQGNLPADLLRAVPLTDVALGHLNSITGVPAAYSARIDATLHAKSLNKLLSDQLTPVTVVVEADHDAPEQRHVSAVLLGGRLGLDDAVVLQVLERRGLGGVITLRPGSMEVRSTDSGEIEALTDDVFRLALQLLNDRWATRAGARPALDIGVHLLRVVCQNGAVTRRSLAQGRLMACSQREVEAFLNRKIDEVLSFPTRVVPEAVQRMSNEVLEGDERDSIERLLARYVGRPKVEAIMTEAVSMYDGLNAVTQIARDLANPRQRRALEIHAGAMLERYFGIA